MSYLALPITLGIAAWMYLAKIHFPLGAYAAWAALFSFVSIRLLHHAQLLPGPIMSICNSALRKIPKSKLEELRPEHVDSIAGDPVEIPDLAALVKSGRVMASSNNGISDKDVPAKPEIESSPIAEELDREPEMQDAPEALQAAPADGERDEQVADEPVDQPEEVQADDVQDGLAEAGEPEISDTEPRADIGGLDLNAFPDFDDFGDEESEGCDSGIEATLAERVEGIDDAGCSVTVMDHDALNEWASSMDSDDAFAQVSELIRDEAEIGMWFIIRVSVTDGEVQAKGGDA